MPKDKLKVATIFSGIGAAEFALKRLNIPHDIVFACDNGEIDFVEDEDKMHAELREIKNLNDRKAYIRSKIPARKTNFVMKSYMANYDIDPDDYYFNVRFLEGNEYRNKVDLFVGGSPCQSFTLLGYQKGLEEARGTLFYEFARLVDEIQPKAFIYENVQGLIKHDKEYVLERIIKELNLQFNTHRQILLKTLYAYVSQDRKMLDENDGISMFGTTAYHAVWEKACAEVFDNKLNTTLAQLKMTVPLADKYNSKTAKKQKLIDIIEKPIWQGEDTEAKAADTLIPDLISIPCIDGKDWFIIFDAKYYNLQLEKGKSLRGNPGVGDVTKQYLYQLAYKDFINAHGIAEVRNCFLMPTEKKDIVKKGCARMAMLEALNLKNIQIRLIPAAELYDNYLTGNHMDITQLEL